MKGAFLGIERLMTTVTPSHQDELFVVETDDEQHLGALDTADDGRLWVRTGRRGHPVFLIREDVVSVTPAAEHPLVETSH